MSEYFSHNIIRNHVGAFGSLFDNIHIKRYDETDQLIKDVKVPVSYINKDKLIQMYLFRGNDPSNFQDNVKVTLPRIGFELVDIRYNSEQKINRLNEYTGFKPTEITNYESQILGEIATLQVDDYTTNTFFKTKSPVPYKLRFNLHIGANKQKDYLQILEQILPLFTPNIKITVNYDLGDNVLLKFDEAVTLLGVHNQEVGGNDFNSAKRIVTTLTFEMECKFFREVSDDRLIKVIKINFSIQEDGSEVAERINMFTAPLDNKIVVNLDRFFDEFSEDLYHDTTSIETSQIFYKK
jgi:hypothetical protein